MKKIITTTAISLCYALWLAAQAPNPLSDIAPQAPISTQIANALGYRGLSIWYEVYTKAEQDESGMVWSTAQEPGYQQINYAFPSGKIEQIVHFQPSGKRQYQQDFYYKDTLLSAIDEIHYDSTEREQLLYVDVYLYKHNGQVFQRTREFKRDRGFRSVTEFRFDSLGHLTRAKTDYTGQPSRAETLMRLEHGKHLIAWERNETWMRRNLYESFSRLAESQELQLENGKVVRETHFDAAQQPTWRFEYEYEGDRLVRIKGQNQSGQPLEAREDGSEPSQEPETIVQYFFYNEEGLLARKIVEHGHRQEVFTYNYTTE